MALTYVLGALALLSMIAASLINVSNASHRFAANAYQIARSEAIAEAAVARAVLALLDPRLDRRWRVDGVPQQFMFDGVKLEVTIQDELGKIDLNHADASLLVSLFQSAGLDQQTASKLVDKVLDWRDEGVGKRVNGADARDYRVAGLAHEPRNGRFQSVDELKLVMDMSDELFQRIEPAITVYSGKQHFDPQFAPREALLAYPGMTLKQVLSSMSDRERQTSGLIAPTVSLGGRAFRVRVESESEPSSYEAVVRLTGDSLNPYWLLTWKKN